MTRSNAPRGNVLLMAVIAVVVLTVLVVGAIQFTGQNRVAANLKGRGDKLSACSEASRNYLLSKLQQLGGSPTIVSIDERLPDDATQAKQTTITSAHYGGAQILSVIPVSGRSITGSTDRARDLSNTIARGRSLGGQYYRVVVTCREPTGGESETEFVFRYGL